MKHAAATAKDLLYPPTYFEIVTAMAFLYFRDRVKFAVLEVGLGGRLDATNIVEQEVSVITSIGMDHQEFLGNTIEAIAAEKAGIIKGSEPVVVGPSADLPVIREKAGTRLIRAAALDLINIRICGRSFWAVINWTTSPSRSGQQNVSVWIAADIVRGVNTATWPGPSRATGTFSSRWCAQRRRSEGACRFS